MLYTLAIVLLILWLLGLATSVTMGGLVHVLPVIAVVVILLRLISRRKVTSCGVIENIRRLEPAGNLPPEFEFTVRLRDGSRHVSSAASQGNWQPGDRIMLMGGVSAASQRNWPSDDRIMLRGGVTSSSQ